LPPWPWHKPCRGGELVTLDIVDQRGQELLDYAGPVSIRFIKGDSAAIMADLVRQGLHFDLVFIDGGHHYSQVKADWDAAQKLTKTVLFHDALQFQGVARVVNHIRRDPQWDVMVLDYPGITLTGADGLPFASNRTPGMALATFKRHPRLPDLQGLPGHPTSSSRKAVSKWKSLFAVWESASTPTDLGALDLEMILHLLWDFKPEVICHAGHVGTAATFLFQEYARQRNIRFLPWDVSGTFFADKRQTLPEPLVALLPENILGLENLDQVMALIGKPRFLLWLDAWGPQAFYENIVPELLRKMSPHALTCLRSFSPHDGRPNVEVLAAAQCTNPNVTLLCKFFRQSNFTFRLARPELVFGDYVNAGHWMYVTW
jgi:hypothetical protein